MAAKRVVPFNKQSIGEFIVDAELSTLCIVAKQTEAEERPLTSAAALRKKKLEHPWDWVKKGTEFRGSILGYEVFVPQTEAIIREKLTVKAGAIFRPGNRFQKNSEKAVSFLGLKQNHILTN